MASSVVASVSILALIKDGKCLPFHDFNGQFTLDSDSWDGLGSMVNRAETL
jgi:hypothetical protein